MKKPLSIPVVLEYGSGGGRNQLEKSRIRIEVAALLSGSPFNLIETACASQINTPQNENEFLSDIQNVCLIGKALDNSIGESITPLSQFIYETEKTMKKDEPKTREARLIDDLAAINETAAADIEALKMSDADLADIEELAKKQADNYTDLIESLRGEKDETK